MSFTLKEYSGDPVFVGSSLKLIVPMEQDLTSATSPKIHYRKPDGTAASWVATIETPATGGNLSYEITTEVDQSGDWRLWGEVVLDGDTQVTIGAAQIVKFNEPGEA